VRDSAEKTNDCESSTAASRIPTALRVESDPADATLGARIRRARDRRIPYVAVIGDRDSASDVVALRLRDGRHIDGVAVDQLVAEISRQVTTRALDLGFAW
jgi:threonyl-tRNA synthetase